MHLPVPGHALQIKSGECVWRRETISVNLQDN